MSTLVIHHQCSVGAYTLLWVSLSCLADVNDVQKRRRLEVLGNENVSPTKKSSTRDRLRCAELVKPDTPALCSVRSRVQQLTQRREGKRITPPPKITNSEPVYSIDRIRIWQYPCNTQICSHWETVTPTGDVLFTGGHVLAQRCLSDPGSGVPSIIIQEGFKENHLIGE